MQTEIHVYTDGACKGNPGSGGYGVVIIFPETKKELSQGYKQTTNNRMELLACIKALEYLEKKTDTRILLYTDSKYVQQGITQWIKKWRTNNWFRDSRQKEPVKNKDLWMHLDALQIIFTQLSWHWVKAHADNKWNDCADRLAQKACYTLPLLEDTEKVVDTPPSLFL